MSPDMRGYKCCALRAVGQRAFQCDGRMVLDADVDMLICTKCDRHAEPDPT